MRYAVGVLAAIAVCAVCSSSANAACTPAGMAQFRATEARMRAAKAKILAGNCAAVAEWKSALAAQHAILRDSQRQTYPYTCNVTFKYPAPPKCGGTREAKAGAANEKAATAKPSPVPADTSGRPKSASCSDITGTSGAPAPADCKTGDSLLAAARSVRTQNPSAAAETYKQAADAYRRAGDVALATKILEEALGLVAAAKPMAAPPPQISNLPADDADDKNIPSPCEDLTGPFGCQGSGSARGGMSAPPVASSAPAPAAATRPRIVTLMPPRCSMCDVLKTVGEVLPDLAEKLDAIKPETLNDIEPPLYDGGPNTLHPYLPRRPLVPVSEPESLPELVDTIRGIADDSKALTDLGSDNNKDPEDYAETCRDGFRDGAWKAFTAADGSYYTKVKAATDSLVKCWKASVKHFKDTASKAVTLDPQAVLEDN